MLPVQSECVRQQIRGPGSRLSSSVHSKTVRQYSRNLVGWKPFHFFRLICSAGGVLGILPVALALPRDYILPRASDMSAARRIYSMVPGDHSTKGGRSSYNSETWGDIGPSKF